MARNVSLFTGNTDLVTYIPDVDNNRDDPDPFYVKIAPMTAAEFNQIMSISTARTKKGDKNSVVSFIENKLWATKQQVISKRVIEVGNYTVHTREGTILEPKNGEALVDAVLCADASELVILDDIFNAITDHSKLSEGLRKN